MAKPVSYSRLQIALHWLVAILIAFNYFYSEGMGDAFDAKIEGGVAPSIDINPGVHVWVGVAILLIVLTRLFVRLSRGVPKASGEPHVAQAAEWVHRLLYLLLIGVPVLGSITWFGLIDATADLHALLANVLIAVAGLHAVAALVHHFVFKDGVLLKMFRST